VAPLIIGGAEKWMKDRFPRRSSRGTHFIQHIEQIVYLAIGALLIPNLVLALAGAGKLLWDGLQDWSGTTIIFRLIDPSVIRSHVG
jgi:hypothetical protein